MDALALYMDLLFSMQSSFFVEIHIHVRCAFHGQFFVGYIVGLCIPDFFFYSLIQRVFGKRL